MRPLGTMSSRETYGYRAIALLRKGGRVLLQRGIGDVFWALPGGGVEPGESAEAAVRRELREELGWDVHPVRPIALIENAFPMDGRWHEQIEIYFEATGATGPATLAETDRAVRSLEPHLEFRWFSASECERLDIRPAAARCLLFGANDTFLYVGRAATSERRPPAREPDPSPAGDRSTDS